MSQGVIYQIDFNAVAAGKRVSSSKRKIRWRFGFANKQALGEGLNGTDCRGEEHDVTIVWSITSGKRQIMMDGKEVHYSTNRAGVLDHSWQLKGNHVVKVTCHAAPPMSAQPGFRQYDLSIDGQSFFSMPKVFQIGIKGAVPGQSPGRYRGYQSHTQNFSSDAPLTREQEDAQLHKAIQASINESRQHLGEIPKGNPPPSNNTSDLLGFAGPPAPQPGAYAPPSSDARSVASYYSAPTTYDQSFQSPPPPTYPTPAPAQPSVAQGAIVPAVAPPSYYQAPPPPAAVPTYASPSPVPPQYVSPPLPPQQAAFTSPPHVPPAPASTPVGDVFGLHQAPVNDPFAPKPPPPVDLATAVMSAYHSPPTGTATPQTPMNERNEAQSATPQTNGNNGAALSMNSLTIASAAEEKPKSEFERALCNLVNIDHIDEPAEGEVKLTMMRKDEKKKKAVNGKSVPKPPICLGIAGSNAPLSQIQKDFASPKSQTTEGVMNAPPPGVFSPHAAQGGALVVHGQGPPPLQQAQGFGVGAMLPNGGFQNQKNAVPGQYMQQQRLYQ
ncbi:unnamed protein product [Pseudo-nitzschia multistriata]|uniref:Uncharacterized protein n=1 Tax=Pseudo-nitzschia multistriata TaxID=183589 RepID=A0A448ZRP0_9STRA|nr:unnamed protein product [Pseudo-nitzschia multistriata]